MNEIESLHNHTTLSDGKMSHAELFNLAESLGYGVLAFTDHDAVPNEETMVYLETLRDRPLKWVIGIEISTGLPPEVVGEKGGEFHMIGLFVDPKNPALLEHCRKAQEARRQRMSSMVANLHSLGFHISEEDCLRMSGGESVGRPHIVSALREHPENEAVEAALCRTMEEESKNNPELAERYAYMIERGKEQYPYSLYLSPSSYRPAYAEHRYVPDMDEAVALIRGAGGIAVVAHYFTVKAKLPLNLIEQFLKEKRLDGMETVFMPANAASIADAINADRAALRELIARYDALPSGGADAHRADQVEWYAASGAHEAEARGMAKRMITSGRVDQRNSSL
jgi:predicted metal-dependent phosphoesterase TrpH